MTDLSRVLPGFPIGQYAHLLPVIEKNLLTTTDLLTVEIAELGRRTSLPLLDLKRLCHAILQAFQAELGVSDKQKENPSTLRQTGKELTEQWQTISLLDESLDQALGGGVPTGRITEVTGESGAGKTQFLLTLLLSVQLPPPYGLGRPALYISTESALSTRRLSQILANHAFFQYAETKPSLDGIISTVTPDLESQDHILQFQVPVEVARRNVGLIIMDSVAANYRAEFERGNSSAARGSNMATRGNDLVRLGHRLRELARKHNLAVVVANQVADRFSSPSIPRGSHLMARMSQGSPLASRSKARAAPLPAAEPTSSMAEMVRSSMPEPPPEEPPAPPALLLDHQQRWFSGWGDDPYADYALKTPSLGLVWSTQIACRIALYKRPVYGRSRHVEDEDTGAPILKSWRRWMKVVFAPHVPPSSQGIGRGPEFEVTMGGIRAVEKKKAK